MCDISGSSEEDDKVERSEPGLAVGVREADPGTGKRKEAKNKKKRNACGCQEQEINQLYSVSLFTPPSFSQTSSTGRFQEQEVSSSEKFFVT